MSDDAPTVRAIPLRARQRHRPRAKKSARAVPTSVPVAAEGPEGQTPYFPVPEASPKEGSPKNELSPAPDAPFDAGAEDFFRAGDSLSPAALSEALETPAVVDVESALEPEPAPASPTDLARRRRLARLVSLAVGFATLLCLVALARTGLAVAQPAAPRDTREGGETREPSAAIAPSPETPPPSSEPAPQVAVESPPPEAAEAAVVREEARALLAKRAVADAIATAKRAVELDPSDAESWLILGAAQIEAMRGADAVLSFRSCVRLATSGPVAECRRFLR